MFENVNLIPTSKGHVILKLNNEQLYSSACIAIPEIMATNQARFSKRIRSQQKERRNQDDGRASFFPFPRLPIGMSMVASYIFRPG